MDENVFYRSLAVVGEDYGTLQGMLELIIEAQASTT